MDYNIILKYSKQGYSEKSAVHILLSFAYFFFFLLYTCNQI